jgi:DNA-binding CsgD family transcriptional regulator
MAIGSGTQLSVAPKQSRKSDGNGKNGVPLPRLTPREREVLDWVANGKTSQEIGEILHASPRTIHKHLQNIFPKLGVDNRTAACSWWYGQKNNH